MIKAVDNIPDMMTERGCECPRTRSIGVWVETKSEKMLLLVASHTRLIYWIEMMKNDLKFRQHVYSNIESN